MVEVPRVAVTLEQCWHAVPGGTASSAVAAVAAMDDRADLDLVGVAARHRRPPPDPWAPPITTEHLRLPRLALYESWHVLRRPAVESATGPVDALYVTGVAVPPRSAPMVLTVHDLAFLHRPEHFTAKGRRFFGQALELAKTEADLVLCPSTATVNECAVQGFDPGRLRLVPWGVDQVQAGAAEVTRVRQHYLLERPYVLSVGTVEPRKNLATVLAAFRRLDRSDLDLVLVGPEGWREDLDVLVGPVRDRVRTLGFVPGADLTALYAGAAVFCYPSLLEGFGLPVLEAMAQGVPVVTSVGTSMAEVVADAGLLVPPTDDEAVAAALASVIDDDAHAARLRVAGQARAAGYTWDHTAALVAEAIHEVVS